MTPYHAYLIIANVWIVGSFCATNTPYKGICSIMGLVWLVMALVALAYNR